MNYRREIDGLRALAVLPVILFHAGFETFSGGFVGVDIFFVISGYLITTIILAELEQGKFSIANFYERRARRILPALFFVMLVCIPFAWFWLLPSDMKDFSQSLVAVSVFSSNILFWRESGYFDTAAELKPLLHTWSLAVEEQYYVIFPIFLMLFLKSGTRWILAALGSVFIASLAIAQWGANVKSAAAFYLLPTRGWELLIGAFAAFYLSKANRKEFSKTAGETGGWLGVFLILFAVFSYNKETPFPGFYALAPTLGTVLIILFATQPTTVGKFVGNKAFVGIGLISYSAYLWHQPLFAFARHKSLTEPSHNIFIFLSAITLLLAYFSWKFIEEPFRNKFLFKRSSIFKIWLIFSLFFTSLGLMGHFKSDSFEKLWVERLPENQRGFAKIVISSNIERIFKDPNASDCRFNTQNLDPIYSDKILKCFQSFGSGVLILGDSHAIDLFGIVSSRFNDGFIVGITSGGCRPHTKSSKCQYDGVYNFIKEHKNIFHHVIYEQAGFYLLLDKNGNKGTRGMFSNLPYEKFVSGVTADLDHINETLGYLEKISSLVPVTWFLPRIEHHIGFNLILANGCNFDFKLRQNLAETFLKLDHKIADMVTQASSTGHLKTRSQNKIFNFKFPEDLLTCDNIFWRDGDHFSADGEILFGSRLPDNFLKF